MLNEFIEKHKVTIKRSWWIFLLSLSSLLMVLRYDNIIKNPGDFDRVVLGSTIVLLLYPLISEISILGFRLQKEINDTKHEMRANDLELKSQIVSLSSTINQQFNQELNIYQSYDPKLVASFSSKKQSNDHKSFDTSKFEVDEITVSLFKLRYALEEKIRSLSFVVSNDLDSLSLFRMIGQLQTLEYLNNTEMKNLRNIVIICNGAVHGQKIGLKEAKYAIDVGNLLLEKLNSVLTKNSIPA